MTSRAGGWRSEAMDWSNPEELARQFEGVGHAPEETLHGLDQMWAAILDEGEDFENLDEDEVELAISLLNDGPR